MLRQIIRRCRTEHVIAIAWSAVIARIAALNSMFSDRSGSSDHMYVKQALKQTFHVLRVILEIRDFSCLLERKSRGLVISTNLFEKEFYIRSKTKQI